MLQSPLHFLGNIRASGVIHKHFDLRLKRVRTFDQLTNRMAAPHQAALFGKVDFCIRCIVKPVGTQMKLRRKRL